MPDFEVVSPFRPAGDQPEAIAGLVAGLERGDRYQTLLGITGSGKTATIAWTIEAVQRPTLIIEPNKSLAAQLAAELKEFFPRNRVEYFVSYYDYYQPEAYVPSLRHLHREGLVDQRRDRPSPSRLHLVVAPPARHHRGCVGVVHLRPRFARRIPRSDHRPPAGEVTSSVPCSSVWSTSSTPERRDPVPRAVPGPG